MKNIEALWRNYHSNKTKDKIKNIGNRVIFEEKVASEYEQWFHIDNPDIKSGYVYLYYCKVPAYLQPTNEFFEENFPRDPDNKEGNQNPIIDEMGLFIISPEKTQTLSVLPDMGALKFIQ